MTTNELTGAVYGIRHNTVSITVVGCPEPRLENCGMFSPESACQEHFASIAEAVAAAKKAVEKSRILKGIDFTPLANDFNTPTSNFGIRCGSESDPQIAHLDTDFDFYTEDGIMIDFTLSFQFDDDPYEADEVAKVAHPDGAIIAPEDGFTIRPEFLRSCQMGVNNEIVNFYRAVGGTAPRPSASRDYPVLLVSKGVAYVQDGHHRLCANLSLGKFDLRVAVVEALGNGRFARISPREFNNYNWGGSETMTQGDHKVINHMGQTVDVNALTAVAMTAA